MPIEYGDSYIVTIPALAENANIVQAFQQYHDDMEGFLGSISATAAAKQDAISGAASSVTSSNLIASRAVISDTSGKIAASTVTSAELANLSGTTGKTGSGNLVFSVSPTITTPTISGNVPDISIAGTLRAISTEQASLSSTLHPLQIGVTSGQNLAIDNNEIISRNNGAASSISINPTGGNVTIGSSSSAISIPGTLSVAGGISGKRVQEIVNRSTSGTISLSGSQAARIHRTTHSSSTVTYTIDDTTLALGESFDILRGGNGEVAIAYSGGGLLVSESNKRRLALPYSAATILCVAESPKIYHLVGSLKT